jgi:hypothetical protein
MSTITDASGRFTFEHVPSGWHELVVHAVDFKSSTRLIFVPQRAPLRVALCPVGSPNCGAPGPDIVPVVGPVVSQELPPALYW